MAAIAKQDTVGDLSALLAMFKPGGGLSQSQTTSENTSQASVNALMAQILGGSQGLATVAAGQKSAGMYNSTTNQMLTNDLIARTAASGAQLNKSSTVNTNKTPTAQLSAGKTLASLATGLVATEGLKKGGKGIWDAVTGSGTSAGGGSTATTGGDIGASMVNTTGETAASDIAAADMAGTAVGVGAGTDAGLVDAAAIGFGDEAAVGVTADAAATDAALAVGGDAAAADAAGAAAGAGLWDSVGTAIFDILALL